MQNTARQWTAQLIAIVLAMTTGWVAFGLIPLPGLTRSEWPAWVQAVGSVVAIISASCVAIWVPWDQRRRSIDDARRAALTASYDITQTLWMIVAAQDQPEIFGALQERGFPRREIELADAALLAVPTASLGSSKAAAAVARVRHAGAIAVGEAERQRSKPRATYALHAVSNATSCSRAFRDLADIVEPNVPLDSETLVRTMVEERGLNWPYGAVTNEASPGPFAKA